MASRDPDLFREEAVLHSAEGRAAGDVLRLSPAWAKSTYWLLVAAFTAAVLFAILGSLHEYATGPAVVWVAGRSDITAKIGATVTSVDVRPGERVERGAVIARFDAVIEQAELDRIDREIELLMLRFLRDPSDEGARQALAALRAAKQLAEARVDELKVRAPGSGVVGDVRIRPGQRLVPGDIVVTLIGEEARFSIVAMLPAHYRPQLSPGARLRFEVTGYKYAYQEMIIESVSAQIIGPAEVRRYLGPEIADTVKVDGPVVLVYARPPSPTFRVDGEELAFYHGMNGVAEARVRTETIALAFLPALRTLLGGRGE